MNVIGAANLAQEELQILSFRETRQLRNIVQSHIDESLNSIAPEESEELRGVFLRETDRKDLHGDSSAGSNKVRCTNVASPKAESGSKLPSPRRCKMVTPRRARTRPTRRCRWQTAGFSSLHMIATQ